MIFKFICIEEGIILDNELINVVNQVRRPWKPYTIKQYCDTNWRTDIQSRKIYRISQIAVENRLEQIKCNSKAPLDKVTNLFLNLLFKVGFFTCITMLPHSAKHFVGTY